MTNSKFTKKALVSSIFALFMCVMMLIGTTFAWFTDTASTSVNKIQAGTLDIEIQKSTDGGTTWTDVGNDALQFIKASGHESETVLWEPGAEYKLPMLRIVNNGNLALKYKIIFSSAGGDKELADVLDVKLAQSATAGGALGEFADTGMTLTDVLNSTDADGVIHGELLGKTGEDAVASETYQVALKMKESAGNEYQNMSIDGVTITVVATQLAHEWDSTTNQYDVKATYLNEDADGNILISSASELRYFAAMSNANNKEYMGRTIKLTSDIDLGGAEWTPINMEGGNNTDNEINIITFDGQDHTISNFKINATEPYTGLFGVANFSIIKNLTVDNATVTGVNHVGAIVGHGMVTTIDKCKVTNSNITTAVRKNAQGNWDDGDKAGAIIGWTNEGKCNITNCTVESCTITGYRDFGGVVGYYGTTGGIGSVKNNTVKDVKLVTDRTKTYGSESKNIGDIVGRCDNAKFTLDTSNTATGVTKETKE